MSPSRINDPALVEEARAGDGDDELSVIIRLSDPDALPAGVQVVTRFGDIATVRLLRAGLDELAESATVTSLEATRKLRPSYEDDEEEYAEMRHDLADAESIAASESSGRSPYIRRPDELEATGKGCIVAALDWGLDHAHPAFRHENGSTRILSLWDQRGSDGSGPGNRWGYGRIFTSQDIDQALRSSDPYQALNYDPADAGGQTGAHGSHVLDIAAGSGLGGGMSGVAPEADLVFVHLARTADVLGEGNLGDSASVLEALDHVFTVAGNRPCVVNMSVGAHGGPHDGSTLVELGIDQAVALAPGRAVVNSAGNYRTKRAHATGRVLPASVKVVQFRIPFHDTNDSEIEIFYPHIDRFTVEVLDPSGAVLARVSPGQDIPMVVAGTTVGHVHHRVRHGTTGDHHVDVLLKPDAPDGIWALRLIGESVHDGRYHAWIERDKGLQPMFVQADVVTANTTGTLCNGRLSITCGCANPHQSPPTIASFSSGGPTRDGRIKPELVAPGSRILAARSTPPGAAPGARYTVKSGTSMAAPHVTGTVALMFEAAGRPLEIYDTRALLFGSVDPSPFFDRPELGPDLHRIGYGYLDIVAAERVARDFGRENRLAGNRPARTGRSVAADIDRRPAEITAGDAGVATEGVADMPGWVDTPSSEESEFQGSSSLGETIELAGSDFDSSDILEGAGSVPTSLSMRTPSSRPPREQIPARILWPALGFPAVICPRATPTAIATLDVDATRCITVLVVSDRQLSKAEAARYLRCVPWSDRSRRNIPSGSPGSFQEEQLVVRSGVAVEPAKDASRGDPRSSPISFGGDHDGNNAISANLAKVVQRLYKRHDLEYFNEIRVSEEATARLGPGQYHLFWNNASPVEDAPSDELAFLIREHATQRGKALPELWAEQSRFLLGEYEYEYGSLQAPDQLMTMRKTRAEILHPVFIQAKPADRLRVGHVTDLHVDVRMNVYNANLRKAKEAAQFNNWNVSVAGVYAKAKEDADVLLLTGDLIDYGRGHWGLTAADKLGDDRLYNVDRNWFLFSYLLASKDAYSRPVYTILGNHDWRINPYPPFAPGAPGPSSFIHNECDYSKKELDRILRVAHGPGFEPKFSYHLGVESKAELLKKEPWSALAMLVKLFANGRRLNESQLPTETTVDSVKWYLLSINPFLDYSFALPGSQRVLMLDWAEDEDVLFDIVRHGKSRPYGLDEVEEATDPGPKAGSCLSELQMSLVNNFLELPGKAKIIGIHAPPICPYDDWTEHEVLRGRKTYEDKRHARGPLGYATKRVDGGTEAWNGHPLFAVKPAHGADGMTADYNSFVKRRDEFIMKVANPTAGVRLVLAGHIHRNGLYVVYVPGKSDGAAVAGLFLMKGVVEAATHGVHAPAASLTPEGTRGPLYVNTTSAGPQGKYIPRNGRRERVPPGYAHMELSPDGTIHGVEFRQLAPPPKCSVDHHRPGDAEIAGELPEYSDDEVDFAAPVPDERLSVGAPIPDRMPRSDILKDALGSAGWIRDPAELYQLAFQSLGVEPTGVVPVTSPGSLLVAPVQPGDLLLRSAPTALGHYVAVIVSDEPEPWENLVSRGVRIESGGPGSFVEVIEVPNGGGPAQTIGRRLTDACGRVPRNQCVFRAAAIPDLPADDRGGGATVTGAGLVDPFPASAKILSLDMANSTFWSCIDAAVQPPDLNRLCTAVIDLTDDGTATLPPYWGHNDTELLYIGSLAKIYPLIAAFELRRRVTEQAQNMIAAGLSTTGANWQRNVFDTLRVGWKPKLDAAFPGKPSGMPNFAQVLDIDATGTASFRADFIRWIERTTQQNSEPDAGRYIRALSFPYINGVLAAAGFFRNNTGLWIAGDYNGNDWLPNNASGIPLTQRWQQPGHAVSNFTGTAQQIARYLALMAQGLLVQGVKSDEFIALLGTPWLNQILIAAPRSFRSTSGKVGIGEWGGHFSDGAIATVDRASDPDRPIRYVAVVLGSPDKLGSIRRLEVPYHDCVVSRHP
ncbi:MAG: S8 family serine peptidase [Gemmatimonadaceae bacterium]